MLIAAALAAHSSKTNTYWIIMALSTVTALARPQKFTTDNTEYHPSYNHLADGRRF